MPFTSNLALPYPALSDPPNGPAQMQALAEAVESSIIGRVVVSDPNMVDATTGWARDTFDATKQNGFVWIHVSLQPNASVVADLADNFTANGNVTADPAICTLPVGWRPLFALNATISNGVGSGECVIGVSGVVQLRTWSGGQGLVEGANTRFTAFYPIP